MEGGGENIIISEPAKYSTKVIQLTSPVRMSDFTF